MDPFNIKASLKALAASKRQEPSSYQPPPQEEPRDPIQKLGGRIQKDIVKEAPLGLLERAGGTALSGLATVGNLLDVPGSMVRDVATWLPGGPKPANPFDQLASPFTHHNRTTGRDLLRGYGLAGKEDTMGNFTTGIGAEIALDPLTYLTFGASALTRGGRAAKALNMMDDAPEIASRLLNRKAGKREARHVVTPRMLLDNPRLNAETRARLQQRMTEMGVTEKDMDRQLGGLAKINLPFSNKPFKFGGKPFTFWGLTDEEGIIGAGKARGRGPDPLLPVRDPGDVGPPSGGALGGDGPDIPPTEGPAPDLSDVPDSPATPDPTPEGGIDPTGFDPNMGMDELDRAMEKLDRTMGEAGLSKPEPQAPPANALGPSEFDPNIDMAKLDQLMQEAKSSPSSISAVSDIQKLDENNFGVVASIPNTQTRARATLTYASEADETPLLFIDSIEKQPGAARGSGRALIKSMVAKVKDRNPMGVAGNFDTYDQLGAFGAVFGKENIRFLDRTTGQPVDIPFAEANKAPSKYTAVHYFIEPPKASAKVDTPQYKPEEIEASRQLGYEIDDIPRSYKEVATEINSTPVRLLAAESAANNLVDMVSHEGTPLLEALDDIERHVDFRLDGFGLSKASPAEVEYAKKYLSTIDRPLTINDLIEYGKARVADAGKGKAQSEAERIFKKYGSFDMDEGLYYRAVLGEAPKPKQQKRLIDDAGEAGLTFKTERGSEYKVLPDGTTQRNKAKRWEHGNDSGIKEPSAKTIYVDDDGRGLSGAGLQGINDFRVVFEPDNTVSLVTLDPDTGKWGRTPSSTKIKYYSEPAIGRHPLELWKREDLYGLEGYRHQHIGNKIVEISKPAAKATPSVPPQIVDPVVPPKVEVVDDAGFLQQPQNIPPSALQPDLMTPEVVKEAKKRGRKPKAQHEPQVVTTEARSPNTGKGYKVEIIQDSPSHSLARRLDDGAYIITRNHVNPDGKTGIRWIESEFDKSDLQYAQEVYAGKASPVSNNPITQPMSAMEAMQAEAGIKPTTPPNELAVKTQALLQEVANKRGASDAEVAEMLLRGDTASAIRRLEAKPLDGLKIDGLMSVAKKNGILTDEQADAILNAIPQKYKGGMSVLDEAKRVSDDLASKSKLESRIDQTETPEFKNWFGDWKKDPANASKVVDPEGKPLVVYHGTNAADFNSFTPHKPVDAFYWNGNKLDVADYWDISEGKALDSQIHPHAINDVIHFGDAKTAFEYRLKESSKYTDNPLSNRHIADLKRLADDGVGRIERKLEQVPSGDGTWFTPDTGYSFISKAGGFDGGRVYPVYLNIKNPKFVNSSEVESAGRSYNLQKYKDEGYDGVIFANDTKDLTRNGWGGSPQIVAFYPEQIKSATANRGTFDPNSKNILESQGGKASGAKIAPTKVDLNTLEGLPEQARPIVGDMINKIGQRLFDDVTMEVGGDAAKAVTTGDIDMDTGFIRIYNSAIESGIVDKTTIHELWHHLSKYITPEEVRTVQKEFDDAVKAHQGPLPYELSSIDEYFAHKLTDLTMKYLGREKPASVIGSVWAKALDVFEHIWDAIRQTLGYDQTKKIMYSFLDGYRADAVKLSDSTLQQRLVGDVEPRGVLRSEIDSPVPVISKAELEQMALESGKFHQKFGKRIEYLKTNGFLSDNDIAFLYSAFKNADYYNILTDVRLDSSLDQSGKAGQALTQIVHGLDKYGEPNWGMFEILLNKNVKNDRPRLLLHELGHIAYFTMDSAMRGLARDAMSAFAKTKEGQKYFSEVYGDRAFTNGTLLSDYFMSDSSEMFAQLFADHLTRRAISNNSNLMVLMKKTWEKVADIVARVVGYDRSARTHRIVAELMDYAAGFKQEDEFLKAIGDVEKSLSSNASEASRKAAEIFFGSETHKALLKQGYSLSSVWGGGELSGSKLMARIRKMLKDTPTSERKALATLIENNDTPFVREIELGNDIEVKDAYYMPSADSSAQKSGNILESQVDPVIPNRDIAGQLAQAKSAILGKSLDDIGESILDSAVGRQLTAMFDQSVLGQITKAGIEAARLSWKGYREGVFKEREYMSHHLRTWYDLPNIREDIIMDEELGSLDEFITAAGGDKALGAKNRMIAARKIQNGRVNDLRRLLEKPMYDEEGKFIPGSFRVEEQELPAWVGQEKVNGQVVDNPARRQQVAQMFSSWRLKNAQILGDERKEGIVVSLVNGYFARLVSNLPGNNRSLWNPNYGKILDPTHPNIKRRKDWFVGYDDGTAVINDISVDAELSGAHARKLVREQISPAEIRQYGNVLWERYKDRLMGSHSQMTYGELAQADPKAFAKINKLTEEIMNLDPRHVEYQIPLFSNDLFSAMELRLEHHHRSIMHAKAIQHLIKKNATARNLIGGDGRGITLNELLKESKYDSKSARHIMEVGTRGETSLVADKHFWDQEIQPRINEVIRHYQAETAHYLRNPTHEVGTATGVAPYTDPGGRAFQVLPYEGDGIRRLVFPQFFDKKVPDVPNHVMKLEVNLDNPAETMVTWYDQVDDGANFVGESLSKILDNPTNVASREDYVSGLPLYALFDQITVPQDVGDAITKFVQGPRTLEEVKPIVRGYDKATNMWKMMQTGMLPFIGFHGRNFGSGQASNFYLGIQNDPRFQFKLSDPTTYLNPIRSFVQPIIDAHKIATGQTIEGAASMPQFAGMNLTDEAATEALRREMYAQGITGEKQGLSAEQLTDTVGTAASQFPGIDKAKSINPLAWQWSKPVEDSTFAQRWLMPWLSKGVMSDADIFRPGQLGRDLGGYTEALNRLAPYIAMRRQGFDPKAAAREVNRAQVDYTSLSNFNREYTRRLFPFASYTLGMTPTVFGELASRPGGGMGRTVMATTSAGQSAEQGVTPDYIRETASIPLGMSEDGTRSYITGFGLPFEDPLQFAQLARGNVSGVLRELGSRMNPVPKSLIEIMTGRSLYQAGPFGGREIEDLDPTIGRIVANINDLATGEKTEKAEPFLGNPWAEYLLANAGPGRMLNTVRTITDPRKWDTIPWKLALNLGTGVRVADVSPSAQDAILRERLARVMKDFGGRMYSRPYFPDYAKEDWTPQEAEDAAKIDALLKLLGQRAKDRRVQ